MAREVQFVVPRIEGKGVSTVAIVRSTTRHTHQDDFLRALKLALKEWFKTDVGQKAWIYSSEDFNVGDLCGSQSDPELHRCLERQGIKSLVVETFDPSSSSDWTYDLVLRDD